MIGEQVPVLEGIIVKIVQDSPGIEEETLLNDTSGTFHQKTGQVMHHPNYETALGNLLQRNVGADDEKLTMIPARKGQKEYKEYYLLRR